MYMTSYDTDENGFKTQKTDCKRRTRLFEVAKKPRRKKWHKTHQRFLRAVSASEITAPVMSMHL